MSKTKRRDKLYRFRCDNCRPHLRQKRVTLCHKCGQGVMKAIGEG